jgi:hypothetical protein
MPHTDQFAVLFLEIKDNMWFLTLNSLSKIYFIYREAEERYETSQREMLQSERKYKQSQLDADEARAELYEERKMRRRLL